MPTISWLNKSPLFVLLSLVLLSGCQCSRDSEKVHTIAVIPKGTTHVFWKSIHAGAVKAEREFNALGTKVEIIWKGPLLEDDRAGQINVVENFIGQRVSGIILAPLDRKSLIPPVQKAGAAGIPVVIIDSGLDYDDYVSYAATDNFHGGEIAGEHLGQLLEGKGNVILLRLMVGSASTEAREAGFLDAIGKFPEIRVLSSNQYAGPTRETAYTAAQNLLQRYGDEVDGIFTPNESGTNGMLLALRSIGRASEVKFIGFDGGKQNVDGLLSGDLNAIVIQDPFRMGYLGVKLMVDHLEGLVTEKQFDTGASLVTIENIQQTEIQEMLNPALEEYLQ